MSHVTTTFTSGRCTVQVRASVQESMISDMLPEGNRLYLCVVDTPTRVGKEALFSADSPEAAAQKALAYAAGIRSYNVLRFAEEQAGWRAGKCPQWALQPAAA